MLTDSFADVYDKFKLHFYQELFGRFQARESSLTAVEAICMEVIYTMKEPTINEFASFMHVSSPNAAYKVGSLIQKGFLEKVQSPTDRREYHLRPTEKYLDEYNIGHGFSRKVVERVASRLEPKDSELLDRMLQLISLEIMPALSRISLTNRGARPLGARAAALLLSRGS